MSKLIRVATFIAFSFITYLALLSVVAITALVIENIVVA